MWFELAQYLAVGLLSGLLAGLLGLGGGLITVPALMWMMPESVPDAVRIHVAVATSLAVMLPTSFWSAWQHYRRQGLLWDVFRWLAPGLMLGAFLSAWYAGDIPRAGLQASFGLLALLAALSMIFGQRVVSSTHSGSKPEKSLAGLLIGAWSALAGVGGGTITVPYLVWRGVEMRRAVGVSAACGLPIAVAGVAGFTLTRIPDEMLAMTGSFSGFIYWPAWACVLLGSLVAIPFGARLTHYLPVKTLKQVLGVMLLFVSARIIFG